MRKYTDYGDPLKDLWITIVSQGDAETLLTLLPTFPPLFREEQKNPTAFWRYAFEMYFPEYMGVFDKFINNNWKKITIWLTFAHRRLLKRIEVDYFNAQKPSEQKFFGLIYRGDGSLTIDTTRIIFKGRAKYVRDWVKTDLQEKSGRLFSCFFDTYEEPGTTFETMTAKLIKSALFSRFKILFEIFLVRMMRRPDAKNDRNYPNATYVNEQWNRFFFNEHPVELRWIFHFLFEVVSRKGFQTTDKEDLRDYSLLFERIPKAPKSFDSKQKGIYLGACIRCEKQTENSDFCSKSCEAVYELENK